MLAASKIAANSTWDDDEDGEPIVQRGFIAVKNEVPKAKDDDDLDDLLNDFSGSKRNTNGAAQ